MQRWWKRWKINAPGEVRRQEFVNRRSRVRFLQPAPSSSRDRLSLTDEVELALPHGRYTRDHGVRRDILANH